MKKTIIALLALAGIAGAEVLTFTPQVDDDATWTKGISFSPQNGSSDLSLTFVSITEWHEDDYTGTITENAYTGANGISPVVQFLEGKNGKNSWTLTFKIANNTNNAITLGGFSTVANAVSLTGGTHSAGINNLWTLVKLQQSESEYTSLGEAYATLGASSASGTSSVTFSQDVVIDAKASQTFTMTFDRRSGEGGKTGFANITSIGVNVIPEPTTATLSLLALAGLAARRRRK